MGQDYNGRKKTGVTAVGRIFWVLLTALSALAAMVYAGPARADDLEQIKDRGVLRHLGIPYARFVTGSGDGLDVELVQMFAASLGLAYEFVPTTWEKAFGDLTGKDMQSGKSISVRGDILASGITILPWRKEVAAFTTPVFASQVWLVARSDHPLAPIRPGQDIMADIKGVRVLVRGRQVTGVAHTCLDPALYELEDAGADLSYFGGRLNDLAPYVIGTDAVLALLDVPDALVALEKWPGQLKVIGPVSLPQEMGVAVAKEAMALAHAFNLFFDDLMRQGRYQTMVEQYYPGYPQYFPSFFSAPDHGSVQTGLGKDLP